MEDLNSLLPDENSDSFRQGELSDRVVQFLADSSGYRLWTEAGTRLDVLRCNAIQPDIGDPEDYCTFMWVWALQGYFLLRQRIHARQPQDWFLVEEVVPEHGGQGFFFDHGDRLQETLTSEPQGPLNPPGSRYPHSTAGDSPE